MYLEGRISIEENVEYMFVNCVCKSYEKQRKALFFLNKQVHSFFSGIQYNAGTMNTTIRMFFHEYSVIISSKSNFLECNEINFNCHESKFWVCFSCLAIFQQMIHYFNCKCFMRPNYISEITYPKALV